MMGQSQVQRPSTNGVSSTGDDEGMMYGYGPGMMRGGYGMGSMGPGYGSGMMGGYGYGPGMMGGYGSGWMGGPGGLAGLGLSAEQQHKIDRLHENYFRHQQQLRSRLYDDMIKMRNEMSTGKPDKKALGDTFDHISQVRKQMFLNRIEMMQQVNQVLTQKQRQRLRKNWNRSLPPAQNGQ